MLAASTGHLVSSPVVQELVCPLSSGLMVKLPSGSTPREAYLLTV